MFATIPTYDRYRSLELLSPMLRGEDVYALQLALNSAGFPAGDADGILGSATAGAIRVAQTTLHLVVDGKAGGLTQRGLALVLADRITARYGLPRGALKGQLEHESGFRVGNYSPLRADGSYDAGLCQTNTAETTPSQGFDPAYSINKLGARIRTHYDKFAGIMDNRRRWALAQGSWNAPAYACWIARQEGATGVPLSDTKQPGNTARTTFEAYVASVSTYLEA